MLCCLWLPRSEGYNKWGYDRRGYNRQGYDRYGYDKYGEFVLQRALLPHSLQAERAPWTLTSRLDAALPHLPHHPCLPSHPRAGYDKDNYDKNGIHKDSGARLSTTPAANKHQDVTKQMDSVVATPRQASSVAAPKQASSGNRMPVNSQHQNHRPPGSRAPMRATIHSMNSTMLTSAAAFMDEGPVANKSVAADNSKAAEQPSTVKKIVSFMKKAVGMGETAASNATVGIAAAAPASSQGPTAKAAATVATAAVSSSAAAVTHTALQQVAVKPPAAAAAAAAAAAVNGSASALPRALARP